MTQANTQDLNSAVYFAEKQPIIKARLMPVMITMIICLVLAAMTSLFFAYQSPKELIPAAAYWIQWFNGAELFLTAVVLAYGIKQFREGNVRSTVTIMLVTIAITTMIQVTINGGMGEATIILFPLLIMVAGFFGNLLIMQRIKRLFAANVVFLFLLGVFGVTPPDISEEDPITTFMRIDQMIYCLLILECCFRAVRMFVNDYRTILSRVQDDQQRMDFIANHDTLTGLPNRYACERHFEEIFRQQSADPDMRQLLLFVDIDNFKNINTRFGHNGGDEALEKVAACLQEAFVNESAVVSRIGGDEFIVMLRMPADEVERRLNEVMMSLSKPLVVFGQKEYVTCSMGVIEIESATSTFKEEYRKADMAMNRAKKTGKNRYCYFNQALNDIALKNIEMGVNLYEALRKDEFVLFYQAQVDLNSGKIVGAEALIRWEADDGRIISPTDFIPIAEKNGSIVGMTNWVIRQACKDCAAWHKEGFKDLFVSVNVPSVMLEEGNLPQIIQSICGEVGLEPRFLELELTESVLLENGDYIAQQLQEIRDMGVSLAIDDFGTGYSNLSYLSRLNVQKLKVDQYFVMNLLKSYQDRTIVQAIAHIANSFGMKTVAEGIEGAEFLEPLRELHCTTGQGYLWSKPAPLEGFMALLVNPQSA